MSRPWPSSIKDLLPNESSRPMPHYTKGQKVMATIETTLGETTEPGVIVDTMHRPGWYWFKPQGCDLAIPVRWDELNRNQGDELNKHLLGGARLEDMN